MSIYKEWHVRLLASVKPCPKCGATPEINESMFGAYFEVGCCGKVYSTNHDDWRGAIYRWNKYAEKPEVQE